MDHDNNDIQIKRDVLVNQKQCFVCILDGATRNWNVFHVSGAVRMQHLGDIKIFCVTHPAPPVTKPV
jgi:hypothetical protein